MSATRLSLRHTLDEDRATLIVTGEIDIATADMLKDQLHALVDRGCSRVVVDLSEVNFCDCRGLSALVAGHVRAREHDPTGGLRLAAPQPVVATLLQLTHLTGLFGVYDTVAEAETAFAERGHEHPPTQSGSATTNPGMRRDVDEPAP